MLPNFLIVGAAKSGTTSIFKYLNQHPQVFIPKKKECRFFSDIPSDFVGLQTPHAIKVMDETRNIIIRNIKEYEALFSEVRNEKAIGDVSPDYLYYYRNSIKNIKRHLGDRIKIIIILRNPIERAYSAYLHLRRENLDDLSFEEAIRSEPDRIANNWWWGYYLLEPGYYYDQVKAYKDNFNNVKIYLYDDFVKNSLTLMKDLYAYLEVDDNYMPDMTIKYNVTGIKRNIAINRLLDQKIIRNMARLFIRLLNKNNINNKSDIIERLKLSKPKMSTEAKNILVKTYSSDIHKLESMVNCKLEHWLN